MSSRLFIIHKKTLHDYCIGKGGVKAYCSMQQNSEDKSYMNVYVKRTLRREDVNIISFLEQYSIATEKNKGDWKDFHN